jgi:hypothetical protein
MSNRLLAANVSTARRRRAGRPMQERGVRRDQKTALEPLVLGLHAVGHGRLKEIIFEYQSVVVMIQIDSQNSGIWQSTAVNLAAFTGAFGSRVAAVRGVCNLNSLPRSCHVLFGLDSLPQNEGTPCINFSWLSCCCRYRCPPEPSPNSSSAAARPKNRRLVRAMFSASVVP